MFLDANLQHLLRQKFVVSELVVAATFAECLEKFY